MIFYNSQLMKNDRQLVLYLVSNPREFTRYADHRAALELQLYELIEQALKDKEDPVALIENNLSVCCNQGHTTDDLVNFLINNEQFKHAMHNLKDHWDAMDESIPEESLKHSTTSREQVVEIYSTITLRNYLEALSLVYEA